MAAAKREVVEGAAEVTRQQMVTVFYHANERCPAKR